jgi:hypothetical protein
VTPRVLAFAATLVFTLPLAVAHAQTDADRAIAVRPFEDGTFTWREVLDDAVARSSARAFRARMVILNLAPGGPHLTEADFRQGPGGRMQVGRAESWLVGRDRAASFFLDGDAGQLLQLGRIERVDVGVADIARKYDGEVVGRADLDTGPALVLVFTERDAGILRERLFVNDATGIVVRRETYGGDGRPVRVVALTGLDIEGVRMDMPEPTEMVEFGHREALSDQGIETLGVTGWDVPRELPGDFHLAAGYALPASDGGAIHLVYSDGLYVLSLYELHGHMAPETAEDAVPYRSGDMHVYRWPGSEPERMVWTGAGRTFTVVTDAPMDAAMQAIAALPSDPPDRFRDRLGRGFARIGRWLWPFD